MVILVVLLLFNLLPRRVLPRGVLLVRSTVEQVGPLSVPTGSATGVTHVATPLGGSAPALGGDTSPEVKPAAAGGFVLERKDLALEEKGAFFDHMVDHVTSSFHYSDFIGGVTALPMGVAPETVINHW